MKKITSIMIIFAILLSTIIIDGVFVFADAKAPYYGMLYSEEANGGFEYGLWNEYSNPTTNKTNTAAKECVTDEKNRGEKSAKFTFTGTTSKEFKLYTTLSNIDEIDVTEDYCWTAWIKTSSDFNGNVSLKMTSYQGYESDGLKNNVNKDSLIVYNKTTDSVSTTWKRFNSKEATPYKSDAVKTFLSTQSKVTIMLSVIGKKGTVWIDDIDFKQVSMLEDDEEIERGDNTGSLGKSYIGLFDDMQSDGGFEYKAWTVNNDLSTGDVKFYYDPYVKNNGKRSAAFQFSNNTEERKTIYTTFSDISEINILKNHCFAAYIKTSGGFDGKVILKLCDTSDYTAPGVINSAFSDETVIFNASSDSASKWTKFNTAENYIPANRLSEFLSGKDAVGLEIIVIGSKGKVFVDDLDFGQRSLISGDDDTVSIGEYHGIFADVYSNGGFEYGLWDTVADLTTAEEQSKAAINTEIPHIGNRALMCQFHNDLNEIYTFKSKFTKLSEIDINSDYFFKSYIKTDAGFDGKISMKIAEHDNPANVLKTAGNSNEVILFNSANDVSQSAYSAFSSVSDRYRKDDLKSFLSGKTAIDIYLIIEATSGVVLIDDIDFINYNSECEKICLEDPETSYSPDDNDYTGMFKSQTSNGGFEYGVWSFAKEQSAVQSPSNYLTVTDTKKTGNRAIKFEFNNSQQEKITLKMTSNELSELSVDDFCLNAFVKTSTDFDGSLSFKITKHLNETAALKNSNGDDFTYLLNNKVYKRFNRLDSSSTPFSKANMQNFINDISADGCFDVYMTVSAKKGSIYIDDVDFCSLTTLEQRIQDELSGSKYDGVIDNGGFEAGIWNYAAKDNYTVELVDDDTHNESMRSIEVYSSEVPAAGKALFLNGEVNETKAATLDTSSKYTLSAFVKGNFEGSVYAEISNGSSAVSINYKTQIYLIKDADVNFDDWHEICTPLFAVTGAKITIKLYFDGKGSLIVDDTDLILDPTKDEYFENGGAEFGAWGGELYSGAKVQQEYAITDNSPAALKLMGSKTQSNANISSKPIDSTKDYKLTISLKTEDIGYGMAFVRALLYGGGNTKWAVWKGSEAIIKTGGTTDWHTYTAILTDLPEWTQNVRVYVYAGGPGTIYIDNLKLSSSVTPEDFKTKQIDVSGGVYEGNIYNGGFEAGLIDISQFTDQDLSLDKSDTYNNSLQSLKVVTKQKFSDRNKAISFSSGVLSSFSENLDTSKSYVISAALKTSDDFDGSVYARVYQQSTGYKWFNYSTELSLIGNYNSFTGGYSNWTTVTTPVFKCDNSDITVYVLVDGIGTVWIDDIDIIIDPEDKNQVNNGGFESGRWSTWGSDSHEGDSIEQVKDVTNKTAKALKLSATSSETEFYIVSSNKSTFDPKKSYKLSVDLKTDSVMEDGVVVRILQWYYPEGETDRNKRQQKWLSVHGQEDLVKAGGTSDGFVTYSVNCNKWVSNFDEFSVMIYLRGAGTVWIDNVRLVEKEANTNISAGEVGSDTPSGEIDALTQIQLFTTDESADIYYTVDGTDPRKSDTAKLFSNAYGITIVEDTKVKAVSFLEDSGFGDVSEFDYECPEQFVDNNALMNVIQKQGTVFKDTAVKKTGKSSVKIVGNGGIVSSSTGHLDFDSYLDYKLEFWVKTENMESNNTSYVSVFLANSACTEVYPDAKKTKGSYYIHQDKMCKIEKNQDWTHYEFLIDKMQGRFSSINITAGINNDFGTMWIDGLRLVPLQYELHPVTVIGDNVRLGNIYDESVLSNFVIEQGYQLQNSANNMEAGVLSYKLTEDSNPKEIISTGDQEVMVSPSGKSNYIINLSMVSNYGTYTVDFNLKSDITGLSYHVGSITVSRIMDCNNTKDSMFGLCSNLIFETQNRNKITDVGKVWNSAGVTMTRTDLDWEKVEKAENVYAIPEEFLKGLDDFNSKNIDLMVILNGHSYPSYLSKSDKCFPQTDYQIERFIKYVEYVVNQLKGKVKYYELFNETNYMAYSLVDGKGYAKLLKEVYKAIKKIDPNAKVIAGATSGVAIGYAEEIFKAGGADYMDYYSFHPYIYPKSPEIGNWKSQIEELHEMMKKYTNKDIHFIITEMGWSTINTTYGVTEQQQLDYFVRTFALAKSLGYIDKIVIYNHAANGNGYYLESEWGLFRALSQGKSNPVAYSAKPAAIGLSAFTNMTDGYKFVKEEKLNSKIYTLKYSNGTKNMYLLWTDNSSYTADITTKKDSQSVYDIYGNYVYVNSPAKNTFTCSLTDSVTYVITDIKDSITSVSLHNSNDKKNAGNNANSTDEEYLEEYEDFDVDSEDSSDTTNDAKKKKVIKKVVKKIIRGKGKGGINWILIISLSAGVIVVSGATFLVFFIIKKKKRFKN